MPVFSYRFGPRTLAKLAEHGVPWPQVLWVLDHAHPTIRRHMGSAILHVVGADQRGDLLVIALLETGTGDDDYEIQNARYLDPDESAAASTVLRGMQ